MKLPDCYRRWLSGARMLVPIALAERAMFNSESVGPQHPLRPEGRPLAARGFPASARLSRLGYHFGGSFLSMTMRSRETSM